jgi:uncharacterized membrane protein
MVVMVDIVLPVALLAGGLAGGALVLSVLGGAPMLLALPVESYLPVHKFLVTRFDPFMPACLVTALACDVAILVGADGTPERWLAAAAVVLYTAVVTVSVTKNVPINKWIAQLDPTRIPENWEHVDPRARWANWNLVRTTLAVLALTLNTVMVGVLL